MYKENFPEKLKEARNKALFTQEEAAKNIGIARNVISNYERGRNEPDIETLGKLADLYEVSTDWLIGTGIRKGRA